MGSAAMPSAQRTNARENETEPTLHCHTTQPGHDTNKTSCALGNFQHSIASWWRRRRTENPKKNRKISTARPRRGHRLARARPGGDTRDHRLCLAPPGFFAETNHAPNCNPAAVSQRRRASPGQHRPGAADRQRTSSGSKLQDVRQRPDHLLRQQRQLLQPLRPAHMPMESGLARVRTGFTFMHTCFSVPAWPAGYAPRALCLDPHDVAVAPWFQNQKVREPWY